MYKKLVNKIKNAGMMTKRILMRMTRKISEGLARRKGLDVLMPLVWSSSRANQLIESVTPTEGVYYVIRRPEGWELFSYRFDEFPETDHSEAWETFVAPVLAHVWQDKIRKPARYIENALILASYAFPRGRVSQTTPGKFVVLHGEDQDKVSPKRIEQAFSISGRAKWEFDIHEQCQKEDRDAVRQLLGIKENWRAV
jgi:hypothetical protein